MGFKLNIIVCLHLLFYLKVESWSCPSMSAVYSRVNDDVTLRFTVTVTTTLTEYYLYSYNTLLGSILINNGGALPNPAQGVFISGDQTGNIVLSLYKVQVSNAGLYRMQLPNDINQCRILYTLGKPTQPRITSNKDPTVGENVKLTCGSSTTTVPSNHSLSMKYTWKINNADVSANTRYILNNTAASLTIVNVNKTDAQSRFTCKAQEDVSQGYMSDNSNNFVINVLYPPHGRPTIGSYGNGDTYSVIEDTTGILRCTINEGNPRPTLTWACYNQGTYTSPVTQPVTKIVTWKAARGTDSTCTCSCPEAVSGQRSTYVNVTILYPPSTPSFTINSQTVSGTNIKVIKGKSFTVTCNSSSEPAPSSYTWKRPDGSSPVNHILTVNNVQTSNNGQYSCKVENTMRPSSGSTVTGSANRDIQLLVLFPPSSIVLTYGNVNGQEIKGNTVDVIVDDDVNIVCNSTAEPDPDFTWNYKGQISTGTMLTFSSISGDKTGSGTCTAKNTMIQTSLIGGQETGTATATVSINVMYRPTKPIIKLNYQFGTPVDISNSLKIMEGRNFTVTCNTASNPASSFSWSSTVTTTTTISNEELHMTNITRQQRGTYTCQVSNTMVRSFGATVTGKNDNTFVLVILYPPEIGALSNKSIVEGSMLQLLCSYTAGSPAETTFKWTRNGDQRVWYTQQLTISNVSRTDDMMYTCSIYNTMNPTNEIEVKGEKSGSFHLNVLYKTSIISFFIHGYENKESVTVDETTNVDFTCHVTSNPESRISVLFHENVIKSATGSAMTHTTKAVTCLDTGIYKCTGQNDINAGIPSVKKVTLYVQCRPSVYEITQENVTSAQNDNVTLNVRILANPGPDTVTWQRFQGNKWISVEESDLVKTSALPIHINETLLSVTQLSLTFLNVTLSNFGQYRMVAKNVFSNITQQFYLQAQDKPDPPTDLVNTGNHLSKVTVQWKPGFDGGLKQTFILRYKIEKDIDWKEMEIADTGEEMMSFTITDLSPGTSYQLTILARNDIGNSSLSEILLVQTSVEVKPDTNAALIGGAAGGGLSFAVLIVVGVLLFRRLRNKKGKDSSEVELDGRRNESDEESSEDEVMTENAMYQSAGDVKQGESNIYAKPQKKSNVVQGGDVYAVVKKPDKSGQKKKVKKNKAHNPALGDIYENSADVKDDKTYTNSAYDENPYENPLVKDHGKKPKRNVNKDGLIYADLTFNDQLKGQKKLVIHGLDSMTEYVEVDFTKKADPLPDSDEEEKSDARK